MTRVHLFHFCLTVRTGWSLGNLPVFRIHHSNLPEASIEQCNIIRLLPALCNRKTVSIVLCPELKKALGMETGRTYIGGFRTFMMIAAVPADPGLLFVFFEDLSGLDILEELQVS